MPKFRRQEWFRYKRLGEKWRRPKGKDSKMRLRKKGKPKLVSIGYRGSKSERGLHPSGLEEVTLYRAEEVKNLDPKRQAIRIASSVGWKNRERIIKEATERGIKVLNPGVRKVEPEGEKKTGG